MTDEHVDSSVTPFGDVQAEADHDVQETKPERPYRRQASRRDGYGYVNPFNYLVEKIQKVGDFLILRVLHPDRKDAPFEGVSILVFRGVTVDQIKAQRRIDPIFTTHRENGVSIKTPIASFVPTNGGWNMAIRFCEGEMKHDAGKTPETE